ncbi:MAG: ABC transporter ATP-binding protein [Candidatus Thiodiazotropha sp.]
MRSRPRDMIRLQQIEYHYPQHPPLFSGLDLEIPQGSLFGLLGPNGAGKTTLISLMTGQRTPQGGEVRIDGLDYRTQRAAILNRLAHIPQDYAFYPQLSALENLQFFAGLYPEMKRQRAAQIARALETTGLTEQAGRPAKHFSGGLKRRLNLAIGLLNQPRLIILDEPTVGIDPQSRHFILASIRALNEGGCTIVYTSHYMEEIEQICSRVAIIDHGRILEQGPLDQILGKHPLLRIDLDPQTPEVQLQPLLESLAAQGLERSGHVISGHPGNIDALPVLLQRLRERDIRVSGLSYGKQTLEKRFFELTQTHLRD